MLGLFFSKCILMNPANPSIELHPLTLDMDFFENFFRIFSDYAEKQSYLTRKPEALYQPVKYILSLGGKRIRPLLVLTVNDIYGGKIENALPVAYSFELFHNFTLVHDDIMDHASLRRGKKTVHEEFGENSAILSGDVMMIWCYEYLSKVSPELFKPLFSLFNQTAIEVCEGQQLDMSFEKSMDVSENDYLEMIRFKTSALIAACLKAGAITGGASAAEAQKFYDFGINIGLAFQLQDDVLDAFGEGDKVGKEQGGDIKNNKKTLLLIKALELGNEQQRAELKFLLSDNVPDKIERMTHIYESSGAKAYCNEKAIGFQTRAYELIDSIQLSTEQKQPLLAITDFLLNRQF